MTYESNHKRNLKNYLKNPIFWIGLIVVLISMYQTLAPYLSIHYVKSDETFRKVKMASDGDVMEGCIPATPDKERTVGERDCKDTSGHREWVWHVGSRGGGSDI